MNTGASEVLASAYPELKICRRSYGEDRAKWKELVDSCAESTLSHGERWLQALQRTFKLKLELISLVDPRTDEILAAGVFSRSRKIWENRYVALPFSDSCTLLSKSSDLLPQLAESILSLPALGQIEIRGYQGSTSWQVSSTFVEWKLRIDRSVPDLRRAMASNFRRQLRRGEENGFNVRFGHGLKEVQAFYELVLVTRKRFGLPAQPFSFFRNIAEIYQDDCEIWLVSKEDKDVAGMFLLRERGTLYYRWSARIDPVPSGASHLMLWSMLEAHAGKEQTLNLGRNDSRNVGIGRFKSELGATSTPLPYSFFPRSPRAISAEHLEGIRAIFARLWQHTPVAVARYVGPHLYKIVS
jgi:hypothetical protein